MKGSWVICMLLLCSANMYAGGGWPQPKGKAFLKISEWWVVADQHYTFNGGIDPNITSGLYNTTFYGEYGVTDRFTVVANVPLLSRSVINNQISTVTNDVIFEGDALNSVGDIDLSLKYGILNNGLALSGSVTFGLPLGVAAGGRDGNLQTGDGEFNQIFRLDAGIPLGQNEILSAYSNLYAGFNNRTNGFSDEYRYGAEAGIGLFDQRFWLVGRYDSIKSRNNQPSGPVEGSFFANNAEVSSISIEASYEIVKNVGLSVGYGTAIDGQIVYAAPSYTVGVYVKL